ncbi:restriction endonuclease subunit S [Nitrosomonas ureae]|uniref:Type I restriction enzyme, S subunit n=1 Tax=Nitrosomonas ureae TaxID=44577 RepID=A0A1H2FRW2_9PROT|nr:restriction endonuclease subunit S [Nitrosomonas ureae]ALQ51420.1 hypothetical protein ATY38_09450 [Nitrosomonas ureae]SDU10079.1 type I restriction enzyme, S subunit [Nitrosomonas ureae]
MSNVVRKMHSIQQEIPLSKTTKFVVDNRGRTAPTEKTGIPLIATNCINNNNLYPVYENLRYVSQETYDNWFRSHPEPGDLLLTLKGSQNGAVCLIPDPVNFVIAQDMVALRVDEKVIDPLFLFAALRSDEVQAQIKNLDVSGVIPHLKKSDFDKLMLPYPERDAQRSIGQFYFYTSKKIDLLHRQNKTLEAMAETLFRQWFVEEVQDNWNEKELKDILEFVVDNRGKTAPTSETGIPLIATNCIKNNNIFPTYEKIRYISEETYSNWFRSHPEPGDLIFVNKGTPGCINLAPNPVDFCIAQDMIALRVNKNHLSNYYLFLFLRSEDVQNQIINSSVGTTIPHLKKTDLLSFKIIIPDNYKTNEFNKIVESFFLKINSNSKQIRTLGTLRDTLLPKLMNGEVRVDYP